MTKYEDNSFDIAIYLQQVISFIPKEAFGVAVEELYKKLRQGGIAIVSVCNWNGRFINYPLSFILQILRFFRKEQKSRQELPWLKLYKRWNMECLKKDQATVYWFRKEEVLKEFERQKFRLLETKTTSDFTTSKQKGMLYFVFQKM